MQRERVLKPFDFLQLLTYGQLGQQHPSLQSMVSLCKKDMTPAALHYRFTPNAVEFMSKCLFETIKIVLKNQGNEINHSLLKPFNRVLLFDSSNWGIHENLKDIFPGSGRSGKKANCKLQLAYNYKTGTLNHLEIVPGKKPDQGYSATMVNLLKAKDLVLFDLGYFSLKTLKNIHDKGAYFICRYLFGTNVSIWDPQNDKLRKLQLIKYLDKSESSFEMEVILGGNRNVQVDCRLICFKLHEEIANLTRMRLKKNAKRNGQQVPKERLKLCDWNLFVTNTPINMIPGRMIRSL